MLKSKDVSSSDIRVFFNLAGARRLGKVVKYNKHTLWAKVMKGAKTYDIIKRHVTDHNIVLWKYLPWWKYDEATYTDYTVLIYTVLSKDVNGVMTVLNSDKPDDYIDLFPSYDDEGVKVRG